MRAAGLVGCHRRRRARATTVDPAQTPVPNLVARAFTTSGPNRRWLGDSTSLPTGEGWRYLAVLLDAHSRRGIGRAMADHLRTELALAALAMVLRASSRAGLVHHTDRGGRYTAAAYQARLAACGITRSMSRAGACLDTAMAESCFATRKAELIDTRPWPTRGGATRDLRMARGLVQPPSPPLGAHLPHARRP